MLTQSDGRAPVLALGFSGGGDSTALLIALREGWPGIPLHALIVDHRLRPDSTREAALAAGRAQDLGAVPHILTWDQPRPGQGAARLARHTLMADACRQLGVKILCLGHTLDDRVETLRMREARGGGASTMAVMAPVSWSPVWPGGRNLIIVRPLAGIWRASLRGALERMGADWIEDPSNADRRYERVRLRQDPLPLNEASTLLDKGDRALKEAVDTGLSNNGLIEWSCEFTSWGGVRFVSDAFASAGTRPVRLAAAALIAGVSGRPAPPPPRVTDRFLTSLFNGRAFTGGGAHLTASGVLGRDPGAAGRADGSLAAPPLSIGAGETAVFDGRYEIPASAPLIVSHLGQRRPGLGEDQAPGVLRPGLIVIEGPGGPELAGPDAPGRCLVQDRVRSLMLSPALPEWFDARMMQSRACAALAVTAARPNI